MHFLHNDAFLHLADVFLLDHPHQVREGVVDGAGFKFVVLGDALLQEALTALLGDD